MALDREPIYVALLARLQGIAGLKVVSRTWRHWTDVDPADQPALFLAHGNEQAQFRRDQPTIWTLRPTLHLYLRHDADPDVPPGTAINAMMKKIEAALERTAAESAAALGPFQDADAQGLTTTLNGLVAYCAISGQVETDEGILQNQGVAIIPLEIVTTP